VTRVITPADIAQRLSVTPKYIRDLCERGELPARKVGKFWRIEEADFEAWWKAGKTGAVDKGNIVEMRGRR
jgi:excisionase family DNA binding protein